MDRITELPNVGADYAAYTATFYTIAKIYDAANQWLLVVRVGAVHWKAARVFRSRWTRFTFRVWRKFNSDVSVTSRST